MSVNKTDLRELVFERGPYIYNFREYEVLWKKLKNGCGRSAFFRAFDHDSQHEMLIVCPREHTCVFVKLK